MSVTIDTTTLIDYAPWILMVLFALGWLIAIATRPKIQPRYVRKTWKAKIPAELTIEEESDS